MFSADEWRPPRAARLLMFLMGLKELESLILGFQGDSVVRAGGAKLRPK